MGAIPSNERKSVDQVVIDLGDSSDSRRLADEYVTTRKSYRLNTGANEERRTSNYCVLLVLGF